MTPLARVAPAATESPGNGILLVVENLPVPYDRRVWQEALALTAAGFQVNVVSPSNSLHPKLREDLEGVRVYRYPMLIEGNGHLGLIFEYLWSFTCIVMYTVYVALRRGFKVIMIANPPDIFFPILIMWRLLGKKTVFDHHDLTPELFSTKFRVDKSIILTFFYYAERRTLRSVHKIISTNESYREIAIRRGRRNPEDVVVVRNSPNPARFSIRPKEPGIRRSAEYMVAFLGEIGAQDGLDILIRSIKSINATLGPDTVHFVVMGGGPNFDRIVRYAREQGVSHSITFTGRANNDMICRVLSNADLAIDPCPDSPHANLSTATKIMEYMYFSLPIVAFDLLETRRSGDDAVAYARINSEANFTQLIIELLEDEGRREELGRAAKVRLESALSWKASSAALIALMDGLIGPRPATAGNSLVLDESARVQGSSAESADLKPEAKPQSGH